MEAIWIPIIGTVVSLGVLPAIVFNFIYRIKKLKADEREMEARTEQLRLEIERDRIRLAIIEAENGRGR